WAAQVESRVRTYRVARPRGVHGRRGGVTIAATSREASVAERIGVGVVGLGFIGPVHVEAGRRLGVAEVVAVAGSSAESVGGWATCWSPTARTSRTGSCCRPTTTGGSSRR